MLSSDHESRIRIFFLTLFNAASYGQTNTDSVKIKVGADSTIQSTNPLNHEKDIVDVIHQLSHHKPKLTLYEGTKNNVEFSVVPAAGYTLQTGFAILVASNVVFYMDKREGSKPSTLLTSIAYTQYNQIILPLSLNIWAKGGKYNIISDMRYMSYPSQTFGLGDTTHTSDGYKINFSYLKLHQSFLRRVSPNIYAGIGYYYDLLWNIEEVNPPPGTLTSFEQYGLYKKETASGICLQALFDNRSNTVNATGGLYSNMRYRVNAQWMGSTSNWQSVTLDLRKYFRFLKGSRNTLAIWNYNWLSVHGKPPYLLLPSTGWDDFFNTGRGYIQGRYRAMNMCYLESEYRFTLTRNGFLGGVIFTDLQTFSDVPSQLYKVVIPGGGFGLRIKVNKRTQTNLCIDYAFGKEGSRGFFINLGEVF